MAHQFFSTNSPFQRQNQKRILYCFLNYLCFVCTVFRLSKTRPFSKRKRENERGKHSADHLQSQLFEKVLEKEHLEKLFVCTTKWYILRETNKRKKSTPAFVIKNKTSIIHFYTKPNICPFFQFCFGYILFFSLPSVIREYERFAK